MGAAMWLGRPRKPRAAAVASADADPDAGGAVERAKREEEGKVVSFTEKQGIAGEVPEPRATAAVAPSDPGAEAEEAAERAKFEKVLSLTEKQGEVSKPRAAAVAPSDPCAEVEEGTASPMKEKDPEEVPGKPGADDITSANPDANLLCAVKTEASKVMVKIEQLRISAIELKSLGVKTKRKLTKAEKIASDTTDRKILIEHIEAIEAVRKEGNCCSLLPPPLLLQFRINSFKDVILPHLSSRRQLIKPGIDMVMWKGSFAVPRSLMSGNQHVDEMNLLLFEVYMLVNDLSEEAQVATNLAKGGIQVARSKAAEYDCRAAVGKLRTTAHDIRFVIVSVGGLPLQEPVLYWRAAFPDVSFL